MERFHGPGYLLGFLRVVQLMMGFAVIPPLGLLAAGSSLLSRALPLTAVAALLVALLSRLAWRTARRQLTADQWRLLAWLIFGAAVAWAVLLPVADTLPPAVRALLQVTLRIPLLVMLPISLVRFHLVFRRRWLPPAAPTQENGEMARVAPRLVSLSMVAFVAAFTAGFVFLAPLSSI
jgi:hypothetical protein